MSLDAVKKELKEDLEIYISRISSLPLHSTLKIRILTLFVYSKLKWRFSIYRFGETWIKQNCDMLVMNHVRLWLNMHPGANSSHLSLPIKKLGFNLKLPSLIYNSCQITTRRLLKISIDPNISKLYELSFNQVTVKQDHIINQVDANDHNMKSKCISILKQNVDDLTWNDFITLKKQNIIIKFLTDTLPVHRITSWQKTVSNMPNNIFSFCRRALILALPTKANLKIWNISDDNICPLCNVKSQTQHHILNNCNAAVTQKRLTWRHDSVLHTIVHHLGILKDKGFTILADLPGFQSPNTIFESLRPDIVLCTNTIIYAIELTICFETNF